MVFLLSCHCRKRDGGDGGASDPTGGRRSNSPHAPHDRLLEQTSCRNGREELQRAQGDFWSPGPNRVWFAVGGRTGRPSRKTSGIRTMVSVPFPHHGSISVTPDPLPRNVETLRSSGRRRELSHWHRWRDVSQERRVSTSEEEGRGKRYCRSDRHRGKDTPWG